MFSILLASAARAAEDEGSGSRGNLKGLAVRRAWVPRVMGWNLGVGYGGLEPSESNLM